MRIAFHVPRASYLEPGHSGDRVQVPYLIAGLRERGHEVKVVSQINVRDFWRGRIPAYRLVTEAIFIRREMKRFSADAWLVYNPSRKNPDLFGWWQNPKRYVLWHTDPSGGRSMPAGWRRFFAFAHRRSLQRADHVAAYHPRSAEELRPFVPPERLHLIPPAIKTWDWMPSRKEARCHLGLPESAPIILCVSRFSLGRKDGSPGKTDMLVDLVGSVAPLADNVVVLLVGDGPGRSRVEAEVAKFESQGRVQLMGQVPDVRWYYAACDVFAYPYLIDRPWVAVLEAQSCGRPVVTMQTDSANLIVADGRTGLLGKDLQEFQVHLANLTNDRARCHEMGESAREYVAEFHSMDVRIRQIENCLFGGG